MQLYKIQSELKVPKNRATKFYKYRSLEDILDAVKPLLAKEKISLVLSDEVAQIGDRYYIKATAYLLNEKGEIIIQNSALAREATQKSGGMDEAQITGSASSYARKYALNGLFAIDDTKDADTDEYNTPNPKKMITSEQKKIILEMTSIFKNLKDMLKYFNVSTIDDFTYEAANEAIKLLNKKMEKQNA